MASGSKQSTGTLTPPSLPIELVEEEILYRLPVKTLMKFQCICKSWKSLISDDTKFAKKHLRMSKFLKHKHHLITNISGSPDFWDSPISSVLSDVSNPSVIKTKQLKIPIIVSRDIMKFCSCDGVLCFTVDDGKGCPVLCNPSIRKYSILPPLENHRKRSYSFEGTRMVIPFWFSFGYDHFNDVYKVIAVSSFDNQIHEVDVYTLGTNNWRSIQDFPYSYNPMQQVGVFVGGTVNWLALEVLNDISYVVSLDLEKESYQKFSVPHDLVIDCIDCLSLGVFKDCLCIFTCDIILAVWIMKEYENEMFWNKLYYFPCGVDRYIYPHIVYIYDDDDQVLFSFSDRTNKKQMLAVYNSKKGNVKVPEIQHDDSLMYPEVYVESLISLPCSY